MLRYIKIDIMVEGNHKPPFFIGSMIRGAFGMSLKRTVCVNPSYDCEECFASKECSYYSFYEEKNVFHPFRLGVTLKPKNLDFSLYLFGASVESFPYVLSALRHMVEEQGLGKERKTIELKQIAVGNFIVYSNSSFHSLAQIEPRLLQVNTFYSNIVLEFTMPLRIKEKNRFALKSVELHTLVNNIHQRLKVMQGEKPEPLGYRVGGKIVSSAMQYVRLNRYSNRQKKEIPIGGLKGKMHIENLDKRSFELLKAGEVIGAGKQTVFGLGSYILKEVK